MEEAKKKQRVMIELDRQTHDRLKIVAAAYGASVRGTIVRYVKAGLNQDPIRTREVDDDGR